VEFAGRVKPGEIAAYYAANDIYIQSPNVDNMPTSVLEAFASGLPVVSTEAGGVPAIVTHGEHGLLARLADYETLGHHVLRLLENPNEARRLARNAYATAHACTWSAVREQWLDAYRSVLPRRRTITQQHEKKTEVATDRTEKLSSGSAVTSVMESAR
jgi:glycosyltransferase involved in cell wall biosynthesis